MNSIPLSRFPAITKGDIHYLLLLALLLGVSLVGKEGILVIAVFGILIALFDSAKIDRGLLRLIFIPSILVLIGCIHIYQNDFITFLKDAYQYINPIIIMTYGYLLARYIKFEHFFSCVILSGGLLALYFLVGNDIGTEQPQTIQELSREVGKAPLSVVFSLGFLLALKAYRIKVLSRRIVYSLILINLVAIFFSFSRTFWFLVIVFFASSYFNFSKRGLIRILMAILVSIVLVVTIANIGFTVDQSRTTFMGKVTSSLHELTPSKYDSQADINANWRGYEAYRGWLAYKQGHVDELLLGHGLGKTADLGLTMKLGESEFSSIYQFHNGYANVLLKTGFIGLSLYLIFFLRMAWRGFLHSEISNIAPQIKFASRMIMVSALVILITTFSISGWLHKTGMVALILTLGWLYGYLSLQRKKDAQYGPS